MVRFNIYKNFKHKGYCVKFFVFEKSKKKMKFFLSFLSFTLYFSMFLSFFLRSTKTYIIFNLDLNFLWFTFDLHYMTPHSL